MHLNISNNYITDDAMPFLKNMRIGLNISYNIGITDFGIRQL